MRERNRTKAIVSKESEAIKWFPSDPDDPPTYSYQYSEKHDKEQMLDVVTPSFNELIRAGNIVNNPCDYVHYVQAINEDYCHTTHYDSNEEPDYGYEYTGNYAYGVLRYNYNLTDGEVCYPETLNPLDGLASAKARAISNLDRTPHAFLEDIGEIRETIRFLQDPFKSLRDLSKSFHKDKMSRINGGLSRVDAIADVWLSYRFALMPLLRSVDELIDAWQDTIQPANPRLTARGVERLESSLLKQNLTPGSSSAQIFRDETLEHEAKAVILYELENPHRNWTFKYGVRFKDLPEAIWALTPYSFMVDRVFNLSEMIRGLTTLADPNVKILAGSTVTRDMYSNLTTCFENKIGEQESWSVETQPYSIIDCKKFSMVREVWEPTVSDTIPNFDEAGLVADLTSTADLFALVWKNLR